MSKNMNRKRVPPEISESRPKRSRSATTDHVNPEKSDFPVSQQAPADQPDRTLIVYSNEVPHQENTSTARNVGRRTTSSGHAIIPLGWGSLAELNATAKPSRTTTSFGHKKRVSRNPFVKPTESPVVVNVLEGTGAQPKLPILKTAILGNPVERNPSGCTSAKASESRPNAFDGTVPSSFTDWLKSFKIPKKTTETSKLDEMPAPSSSGPSTGTHDKFEEPGSRPPPQEQPGSSTGQRRQVTFDWETTRHLLDENLLASLSKEDQEKAAKIQLVYEELPDVHFSSWEWVTHWTTKEELRGRECATGECGFVITTFEAEAILRSRPGRKSIITQVRDKMLKMNGNAKIHVEGAVPYNPWYRYVRVRGRGEVVYKTIEALYNLMKEFIYKPLSEDEIRRALPPRPPMSQRGIRPMILMTHFDPASGEVALNPGYCWDCIKDDHVFCEFDHRGVSYM